MNFRSTADMVRHYCKELLEDGKAHTIPEIRDYVNEKTGQQGIDGGPLTYSHVTNSLRDLCIKGEFQSTHRGIYRKCGPVPSAPIHDLPIQEQICEGVKAVLADARRQIDRCFTLQLVGCPLSYDELMALRDRCREVFRLLEEAEAAIRPATTQAAAIEDQTAEAAGEAQEKMAPNMDIPT